MIPETIDMDVYRALVTRMGMKARASAAGLDLRCSKPGSLDLTVHLVGGEDPLGQSQSCPAQTTRSASPNRA